jgi:hypothetical protein
MLLTSLPLSWETTCSQRRAVKERREFEIHASPLQVRELYGRVPPT